MGNEQEKLELRIRGTSNKALALILQSVVKAPDTFAKAITTDPECLLIFTEVARRLTSEITDAQPVTEALRAQVETMRRALEWQPIETAPTQQDVLIFDRGYILVANKIVGEWVARGAKQSYSFIPSHWMPLPAQVALAQPKESGE